LNNCCDQQKISASANFGPRERREDSAQWLDNCLLNSHYRWTRLPFRATIRSRRRSSRRAQRVSQPRPHASQNQPQQTVRCTKPGSNARVRAADGAGQTLEQQVATRREGKSDCSDRPKDVTHRAYNGQLRCHVKSFSPARHLASHRSPGPLRCVRVSGHYGI